MIRMSHSLLPIACFMLLLSSSTVSAEIITYDWVSLPSVQDGKNLTGSITLDTSGLTALGDGAWAVGDAQEGNFTSWNFTVSGPSSTTYSYSHSSPNPSLFIDGGGSFSIYATRTSLSISTGASISMGLQLPLPEQTIVFWDNGASGHQYLSNLAGNVAPNGWSTVGESTLDAAFAPDGFGGWVIATAVPEPGSFATVGIVLGLGSIGGRRRRKS